MDFPSFRLKNGVEYEYSYSVKGADVKTKTDNVHQPIPSTNELSIYYQEDNSIP